MKLNWSLLIMAAVLTACRTVAAPPVPITTPVAAVLEDETAQPVPASQSAPTSSAPEATPAPDRAIVLATTEMDAGLLLVQSVAATFGAATGWNIQVTAKDPRELRVDMETTALAGQMPDLLWTHGQDIGPLVASELLRPVDDLAQMAEYTPAAVAGANANGAQWGVPVASGDHLVLFRNRRWTPEPPATTDALLALPKPEALDVLLAADDLSPSWLAAWMAGFDGTEVVNQTQISLGSPAIVSTLYFLKELRDRDIIPADMDASAAIEAFRSGRAAMLVASAWSLAALTTPDGDSAALDVGVSSLPVVAATGKPPHPYTSGAYLLVSASATDEEAELARGLAHFLASPEIQARVARELRRLPATNAALQDERITSDAHMQALLTTLTSAVAMPIDGIPPAVAASLPSVAATVNGEKTPEETAEEIRTAGEGTNP